MRRQQFPKLAGIERERVARAMRQDYESGLTLRQVAAKHERSVGGTRDLLVEAGTTFRHRSRIATGSSR